VQGDPAADPAGIPSEPPEPQLVSEQDHVRPIRLVLRDGEVSSERGSDAEQTEEVPIHGGRDDALRLSHSAEVEVLVVPGRQSGGGSGPGKAGRGFGVWGGGGAPPLGGGGGAIPAAPAPHKGAAGAEPIRSG